MEYSEIQREAILPKFIFIDEWMKLSREDREIITSLVIMSRATRVYFIIASENPPMELLNHICNVLCLSASLSAKMLENDSVEKIPKGKAIFKCGGQQNMVQVPKMKV
jgi:hypothetical protein